MDADQFLQLRLPIRIINGFGATFFLFFEHLSFICSGLLIVRRASDVDDRIIIICAARQLLDSVVIGRIRLAVGERKRLETREIVESRSLHLRPPTMLLHLRIEAALDCSGRIVSRNSTLALLLLGR